MAENKMDEVESLLKWLVSGEKDEDGNWLSDGDTQLVCDALEYYLNTHGQKNKMAQVAEMFGKKLGEKFKIYRVAQRDRREIIHGKFTERGLLTTCCLALEDDYDFDRNDLIMRQLLTGKAEIVKE